MEDLKRQFAEHLAGIGFEFGVERPVVTEKLRQRMGDARFNEWLGVVSRAPTASSQEEAYKLFHDIVEGNLMRSLDPGVTLDASFHIYSQCVSHLRDGVRVIELGCWTGGLASFIAARHPNCTIVGVDAAQKVVDACNAHYRLPNLVFKKWNYRWGKPDDLEPADVLLCSLGVVHHDADNTKLPELIAVRGSKEYRTQRAHAIGYFGLWRTAANPGARFFAIFRLVLFPRFLAWIDAAQATGWTSVFDQFWRADLPGEGSNLPGLVFEAKSSKPIPEEAVLDRWNWHVCRGDVFARLDGGTALALVRAFGARSVLAAREYRRGGILTRDEVGSAGGLGYVFTHDAASAFRLLFVSMSRAAEIAALVSAQGSNVPITDEGAFQSASTAPKPGRPKAASPFFGGDSPFARSDNKPS